MRLTVNGGPWCQLIFVTLLLWLTACSTPIPPGCENCPTTCRVEKGHGRCVSCMEDKDCTAPNATLCVAYRCAPCRPGATKDCSPSTEKPCRSGQQTCLPNGTWGVCFGAVVCQAGEECRDQQCVSKCLHPNRCSEEGARVCTPKQKGEATQHYKVCKKLSEGCLVWLLHQSCEQGQSCKNGQCSPHTCPQAECKSDETQCTDTSKVRRCERDSLGCWTWSQATSCPTGQTCSKDLNRCSTCKPGQPTTCYTGPAGTSGVGECRSGQTTCSTEGSTSGTCKGERLPQIETCDGKDNDCNGKIDDGPTNTGSVCTYCGNGRKENGEQCDDKNRIDGDGCSTTCRIEYTKSCKEWLKLRPGASDGLYMIKMSTMYRPAQAYCDMSTDGGGWTLVYGYEVKHNLYPWPRNYEMISGIETAQRGGGSVSPTTLAKHQKEMGFTELRLFCQKPSVGRRIHIRVRKQEVINFLLEQTDKAPQAKGSFERMPDDTSILSRQPEKWGELDGTKPSGTWGTSNTPKGYRLHSYPLFINQQHHWLLYREWGAGGELFLCDDFQRGHTDGRWYMWVR